MKKIGLIGGLGPESTIDYYRGIIAAFKPSYESLGFPQIAVESVDLLAFTERAKMGNWDEITSLLIDRFEVLRRGGAQFGAIASNTPHRVFDTVQQGTALPLLSIVTAAREHAQKLGARKLCLLGTEFTMRADFYQRAFRVEDIEVVVPQPSEIDYIQEKIFSEIEFGILEADTKAGFLRILERMEKEQRIQGVILGCTELPMLLKPEDFRLHTIDTTAIHIAAIVDRCREDELSDGP
jgi:aspartate racemase